MSPPHLELEHLTSPEVRAALEAGFSTVVVPCGAVEQHGPHLPLFVDAEHGTRLGLEVARRLGHALMAPTIRVGISEHHMRFPGTVSLRLETFAAVCRDYAVSLARHGFEHVCFLPTHGGNFRPLAEMVDDLNAAVGDRCTVLAYTDMIEMITTWRRAVQAEGGDPERVGGHADIAESSLVALMHPHLVRYDKVSGGYRPTLEENVMLRIIREGFDTVSPNGVLGDARGLSEAIGRRCLSDVADVVTAYFARVRMTAAGEPRSVHE